MQHVSVLFGIYNKQSVDFVVWHRPVPWILTVFSPLLRLLGLYILSYGFSGSTDEVVVWCNCCSVQCKSSYLELWRCDHYYLCQKNYVYVMTELHRKLWMDLHESFWNGCYGKNQLHVVTCDQGCSGKFWFGGTVSKTWVLATGELVPLHTACSPAVGRCGRGRPSLWGGITPGKFLRFLMPNPVFGGNLGQKINWSRVNVTSTTWFAGMLQC